MADGALGPIKHVVVLMLENRSFDNMLGWLYDPNNSAPFNQPPSAGSFEGVWGKVPPLTNPSLPPPLPSIQVPVGKGRKPTSPDVDPGEPYQDVYAQVYGQQSVLALGQVPPNPPTACNMQGFLYNYTLQCQAYEKKKGKTVDPNVIMNCFTSATVPVLWSLAFYYGCFDHWHASIPTQTLCNRSFLHAGTSSGYVNNGGGDGILFVNDTKTIFNLMQEAGKSWQIYCSSWEITSLALLTQLQLWDKALSGHFSHLKEFVEAAGKPNGLPQYSFIEPIYIDSPLVWGAENDMHPEAWPWIFHAIDGPSNVEQGEKLLYTVYNAVRSSPDWDSTLLLILFDEHGGCYDHVCPPAAIPPDNKVIPPSHTGGSGFKFDRLGVRVPAIVVSPYTPERTVVNTVFDHTSALSTIVNCFGLPTGQLGNRQAAAPDISAALTLPQARTDHPPIPKPAGWKPSFAADLADPAQMLLRARNKPLTDLQQTILIGAAHRLGMEASMIVEASRPTNALDADAYLMRLEAELQARKVSGSGQ